ncbi:MAG TPA: hypothetical protein VFH26_05090 [Gemmatimonadales bacterium]|nr:hypothetical protein [Gemmatimonadales bacterium]
MYLVELRPGKEELYRSSDELALAIRNGDVDSRSRVYHRATAKWISITLHPQYKAIVAAAKEDPAARPGRRWSILGGSQESGHASQPATTTENGPLMHRWRRPLALGLASLLLISGMQLAFSGPRPPWAGQQHAIAVKPTTKRHTTVAQPAQAAREELPKTPAPSGMVSLASSTTTWSPEAEEKPLPVLPRAPRLRAKSLREALNSTAAVTRKGSSLEALVARYSAAHDSARSRLEAGMRVARLGRLFATPRLSASGGITDTRMSLAGAANFIRVYRQQQSAIEKAYQDTVTAIARRDGWSPRKVRAWYSRTPRKDPATLELLGGSLLASIDSVLALLTDQAGAYKIRGTAIAFEDPAAGEAYGGLRRRIKEQIDGAIAAGGATSAGPTGFLLQAIGTTSLPRET